MKTNRIKDKMKLSNLLIYIVTGTIGFNAWSTPLQARDLKLLPLPEMNVPPPPTIKNQPVNSSYFSYKVQNNIEGQTTKITLNIENMTIPALRLLPSTGRLIYEDTNYDQTQEKIKYIPFRIGRVGKITLDTIFHSPGHKNIQIEFDNPHVLTRPISLNIEAYPATLFPKQISSQNFSKKPSDWHIWANLAYSSHQNQQRQYYQITYQGKIVQRFLMSGAGKGHTTPQGNFKTGKKVRAPRSSIYGDILPYWTTIIIPKEPLGMYGTHGLEAKDYLKKLGHPASHGCLRLSNQVHNLQDQTVIGSAQWVYNNIPSGTPITIFNAPIQPFAFQDYQQVIAQKQLQLSFSSK